MALKSPGGIGLKVFVFESISGGGLYAQVDHAAAVPQALMHEAMLMRHAVQRDLSGLNGVQVLTTLDVRFQMLDEIFISSDSEIQGSSVCQSMPVASLTDLQRAWEALLTECDACWLIAPESGEELLSWTQQVLASGKTLLGCGVEAVALASDKWRTFQRLQAHGVLQVNTLPLSADEAIASLQSCVLKPRDGAGADGIKRFSDGMVLRDYCKANHLQTGEQDWIVQPYQSGMPVSMAMLAKEGHAWLLACNQQQIAQCSQTDGYHFQRFCYAGWQVNGLSDYWQAFSVLATQIARAIPELKGYIGVDMILNGIPDACQLMVLEINPRLTTPYAALQRSLGANPAGLLLDLFYNPDFTLPLLEHHSVRFDITRNHDIA